jgi:hypothetical protein
MRGYIVMTASAQRPSSSKGHYRKVALCEVKEVDYPPAMISERARGMVRIVQVWDRLHVGKTDKCEYQRALREAEKMRLAFSDMLAKKEMI